mmetsp:Transcript_25109/g.69021  ORF Transcript_25109/g.69021 Transcript_25109/m.69021 type:complete len:207 (-) Transcript_25109:4267-4887(-)|eukprot:scaffold11187_cov30-Tisochrysis_lutea.AAC.7
MIWPVGESGNSSSGSQPSAMGKPASGAPRYARHAESVSASTDVELKGAAFLWLRSHEAIASKSTTCSLPVVHEPCRISLPDFHALVASWTLLSAAAASPPRVTATKYSSRRCFTSLGALATWASISFCVLRIDCRASCRTESESMYRSIEASARAKLCPVSIAFEPIAFKGELDSPPLAQLLGAVPVPATPWVLPPSAPSFSDRQQ